MKAEQPLTDPGPQAGVTPGDRELDMPIDLRAMFSVQLQPRKQVSAELTDPEARFAAGVWRVEDVEIEGEPYSLIFRSQHSWPAG